MSETEKKNKNADQTLEIIKEILDYNKKFFLFASKVNKRKSEPKPEERIADRLKLKKGKITEIKNEEKNRNNKVFKKYFTNHQSPSDMY